MSQEGYSRASNSKYLPASVTVKLCNIFYEDFNYKKKSLLFDMYTQKVTGFKCT